METWVETVHEEWCDGTDAYCTCSQPPNRVILDELRIISARFDRIEKMIGEIVEIAGPVVESLVNSPALRMLTGGKVKKS